jgi:hypothetical protein
MKVVIGFELYPRLTLVQKFHITNTRVMLSNVSGTPVNEVKRGNFKPKRKHFKLLMH